jgi:hypothetical protein
MGDCIATPAALSDIASKDTNRIVGRIAESLPPLVSTAPPMSPIAARQAVTEYMSAVLAHLQENPTT